MNIQKRNMHSDLPYWEPVKLDGKVAIRFACDNGHLGFLDHAVDRLGRVTPSVHCPEKGCGWGDSGIVLSSYTLRPIKMEARPD